MEAILTQFRALANNPFDGVQAWKEAHPGRKVVGVIGLYVPEEILHGAGLLPIVVPDREEAITVGNSRLQTNYCGYVRSTVDIAMKGQLDFLDGMVMHDCCHTIRGATDILQRNVPQIGWYRTLWFPAAITKPQARGILMDELRELSRSLEEFVGTSISSEAVHSSFRLYNRYRELMRKVYDLRRRKAGLISAADMQAVLTAGMLMPKEECNKLLEELIERMEVLEVASNGKVRLVVSGSLCEAVDTEILDLIEELDGRVVDDDLSIGSRYFGMDVKPQGDPLEAWADAYLGQTIPCPTRHNWRVHWGEYLVAMVKGSDAQGVINIVVKHCEPHLLYYPRMRRKIQEAGIPEMQIETEHEATSMGQTRTRLQAFMETIRAERREQLV